MSGEAVVRTEAAPAPFQGAPYSQAIARRLRVRLRAAGAAARATSEISGGTIERADRAGDANLEAILEAAGSGLDRLVKTTVYLTDLATSPA